MFAAVDSRAADPDSGSGADIPDRGATIPKSNSILEAELNPTISRSGVEGGFGIVALRSGMFARDP